MMWKEHILKDLKIFFNHAWCQSSLKRLLYVWSMVNSDVSYFQGLNELVSPFFLIFLTNKFGDVSNDSFITNTSFLLEAKKVLLAIESDTFWCMNTLMSLFKQKYIFSEGYIFTEDMIKAFEKLYRKINPSLANHLDKIGVTYIHFSLRWMLCLFIREFSIKNLILIWDKYLLMENGFTDYHILLCCALLEEFAPSLEGKDMSIVLPTLQHLPTQNWNETDLQRLFKRADSLKIFLTL